MTETERGKAKGRTRWLKNCLARKTPPKNGVPILAHAFINRDKGIG